jgi:hypothetical protein
MLLVDSPARILLLFAWMLLLGPLLTVKAQTTICLRPPAYAERGIINTKLATVCDKPPARLRQERPPVTKSQPRPGTDQQYISNTIRCFPMLLAILVAPTPCVKATEPQTTGPGLRRIDRLSSRSRLGPSPRVLDAAGRVVLLPRYIVCVV